MKRARTAKQETKRCDSVHLAAAASVEKEIFLCQFNLRGNFNDGSILTAKISQYR